MKKLEKEGILLRMNGIPSSCKEIAKAHRIAEQGSYMRDYIPDEKGGIAAVDFYYVTR